MAAITSFLARLAGVAWASDWPVVGLLRSIAGKWHARVFDRHMRIGARALELGVARVLGRHGVDVAAGTDWSASPVAPSLVAVAPSLVAEDAVAGFEGG